MKKTSMVLLFFGLMVLVGGMIGHLTKGSQASLIAGGISGVLLLCNSFWMFKKESMASLYSALALTFVLDAFFTFRFAKTHSFFPSGAMSLVSLSIIFFLVTQARKILKKPT